MGCGPSSDAKVNPTAGDAFTKDPQIVASQVGPQREDEFSVGNSPSDSPEAAPIPDPGPQPDPVPVPDEAQVIAAQQATNTYFEELHNQWNN